MRISNFWFDLPSAAVGLLMWGYAAFDAWRAIAGADSSLLSATFFLLLGAGFLWMSTRLGAIARRKRERELARKQQALHMSNVGSH